MKNIFHANIRYAHFQLCVIQWYCKREKYFKNSTDGCYPGSWSADGTPECSLCAVGSYSDVYGASECILCPGSTSTAEEGTDSVAKCNGSVTVS